MPLHIKNMRKTIFLLLAGLCLAIACIVWLRLKNGDEILYLTEDAALGNIRHVVSATGEVGAVQLVTVGAQVSGQILKLHVKVGQEVKKGDMVAEIDSVSQENQLATDKARLQSYRAQLVAKQIARRIAEKQYKREKALRGRDAASQESLENMENTLALAEADVAVLEAQIRETELAVSTDETDLGYTRITSPLDGTVVSVPVEEGQTVNAVQSTPTIVQIADLSQMEVKVEISEGDITAVKPGMPLSYTILGEPDDVREAVLTSIDPGLTTLSDGSYKNTSSGTGGTSSSTSTDQAVYYYGKALVDNTDGRLRIGMTAQTDIVVALAENILLVPLLAVQRDAEGKKLVQILGPDGAPETRAVTTGISDGVHVEIKDGLKVGEKVINGRITQADLAAQGQRGGPGGPR